MKKILLIAFVCLNLKTFGQDMIYLVNGNSVPGRITEIKNDSVKFKNLAYGVWPVFSYPVTNIQFAFNNTGNYLIFNPLKPFTDKEKREFIEANAKYRPFDIIVELSGKLSTLTIASETESMISDGKVNINKDSLAFVIRKNDSHELFCDSEKSLPFLIKYKAKIDSLLNLPRATQYMDFTSKNPNNFTVPDMEAFARHANQKMQYFNECLQLLVSGHTDRLTFDEFTGWRWANVFLNWGKNSHVEVFNAKTKESKKQLLSEYINTIINQRRQFDKLVLEFVNVDYATKFRKGGDGSYYGTVTCVQKMNGFKDGNLIYCNKMKVNVLVVLPPYGGPQSWNYPWDVFLDDMGIEETEKL